MTKATVQTIRNLDAERAAKTGPLYLALNSVMRDDEKPAEYRQRRKGELWAEIDRINADYAGRIRRATAEAMEEPQRRYAEGSPRKQEHLTQAQLIVQKYANRPAKQERNQLVEDIRADLRAGNTTGARIKALAADTLNIPLGPLAAELNDADPEKRGARDSLDVIRGVAELALREPTRERAAVGFASPAEQVALKEFARDRKLRWDTPFPAQVEPGYSGPTLESGVPLNAFPEPHDPERDRQRAQMERMGRDSATPDDTAARYAARSQPTGEASNDNLSLNE